MRPCARLVAGLVAATAVYRFRGLSPESDR
jgi:hypothetical protein